MAFFNISGPLFLHALVFGNEYGLTRNHNALIERGSVT